MTRQKKKKTEIPRVLTNSERQAFACTKKHGFAYEDGLSEYDTPAPLKHGSLVHEMLAFWYRAGMTVSIDEIASEVGLPWLEQREDFYENYRGDVDAKRAEDENIHELSLGMVDGHNKEFGDHDREELDIIAVEAAVACQIVHPTSGRRLSDSTMLDGVKVRRNYLYAGAVDLVYRRRSNNAYGYMEHKTTADADLEKLAMTKMLFDPQTRGYSLAARYALKKYSDIKPTNISEVTYNFLRKILPRQPKLLLPRKKADKEAGIFLGVSKEKINTTPEIYEAFVRDNGFDVEEYREFFERINTQFRHRATFSIGDVELANLQKDIYHWALQVREVSKPGSYRPRQTALCVGGNAYRCPYQSLCMEDGNELRENFNIKQVRHEELPGDLAEPWVGRQRAPRRERKKLPILTFKDPLDTNIEPDGDDVFTNEW